MAEPKKDVKADPISAALDEIDALASQAQLYADHGRLALLVRKIREATAKARG